MPSTLAPYVSQQPVDDFGLGFTNLLYSAALATGVDTSLTIPGMSHHYKVLIKVGDPAVVWVSLNQTAAIPVGTTFASSSSELVPSQGLCREVNSGDVLHFITQSGSANVSIALYSVSF
jgi:hypothetical protein